MAEVSSAHQQHRNLLEISIACLRGGKRNRAMGRCRDPLSTNWSLRTLPVSFSFKRGKEEMVGCHLKQHWLSDICSATLEHRLVLLRSPLTFPS